MFIFFSTHGEAAENCFLQNYVRERSAFGQLPNLAAREVTFNVPSRGGSVAVTRILSTPASSPRLRELFAFAEENNIVFVRGSAPVADSKFTTFIGVSDPAMANEAALTEQIERSLAQTYGVPINMERLPFQSRRLIMQMKEKYNTSFFQEHNVHGVSLPTQNRIGIKARVPENLRVNGVVLHEITHNTTERKVFEAFNPQAGKAAQPLTETLAGREMSFRGTNGRPFNSIPGYENFYGADEVEARIRELAQAKKDGLDLENLLKETNSFIDNQEAQLRGLLGNNGSGLSITQEESEEALRAGRRQRRLVTSPNVNFNVKIVVPIGLSRNEEVRFIESTLRQRLETLNGIRRSLQRKFSVTQ